MPPQSDYKTHALLERWANGDDAALSEFFPVNFEKVIKLICLDGFPRKTSRRPSKEPSMQPCG
jgi:hypothetical protein